MKKAILILSFAIAIVLSLTACDVFGGASNTSTSDFVGKWHLQAVITESGDRYEVGDTFNDETLENSSVNLEVKEIANAFYVNDKPQTLRSYQLISYLKDNSVNSVGSWSVSGSKATFSGSGVTATATVSGGVLTLKYSDYQFEMVK